MYQLVSFGPYTCPAFSTQYPTSNFSVGYGTILSIGFQNIGLAQSFWANQAFVANTTQAFVQVTNTSGTGTQWYAWAVVDTGTSSVDAEQLKRPDPELETRPIEGARPG